MLNLKEIYKPTTIQDALKLLQQPGTVVLAGGTALNADKRRDIQAAVDLSALRLSYIKEANGTIAIGAMSTLIALSESPILRALVIGVVAQAAHMSASSILRNQATIAGTLITEPDGVLAVTLLALDARVTIVGKQTRTVVLEEFLREVKGLTDQAIVTEIILPMTNPRASIQTVARTPSDKPIVSVVVCARIVDNILRDARIALGGVETYAVRAENGEMDLEGRIANPQLADKAALSASQGLLPPSDFRGSAEYRKEMAVVLTRRAVKELLS